MAWHDWIGDAWGEFVLARPWRRENREQAATSSANPFKAENWRPREGYFTPKTPAQAARDVNNRAEGQKGDYFNAPAPAFDPAQASPATQRYFRSTGWKGPRVAPSDQTYQDFGISLDDMTRYGEHKYRLTPWQMEQAELDYGIEAPSNAKVLKGDSWRSGAMSQEAFDRLTPAQQNAVRWNGMLTEAVEADRQAALGGATGDEDYYKRVAKMFGTQGGSKVYAPQTMALLENLGMGRLRGQDLDEYLSLDRAYDVDQIRNLQEWTGPAVEYNAPGFGNARSQATEAQLNRMQIEKAGELISRATDESLPGWDTASRARGLAGLPLAPGWRTNWRSVEEIAADQSSPGTEQLAAHYWTQLRDRGLDTQEVLDLFWNTDVLDFGLTEEQGMGVLNDIFQRSYVDMPGGDANYLSGAELRTALGGM